MHYQPDTSQPQDSASARREAHLQQRQVARGYFRAAIVFLTLAVAIAFFTRLFSVFTYTTFDVGYSPDQVRDAKVYMSMWQGIFPSLGPASSIGGFKMLPLYYYLVFPFTVLGPNPAFQALPNALLSFLSVPLLAYLLYRLLAGIPHHQRLFWAGLASFWYSFVFPDIYINTFEWNPGPIPFFLMLFAVTFDYLRRKDLSLAKRTAAWGLYGVTLAILVSLHASTLFVMPVVFAVSAAVLIRRQYPQPGSFLLPFGSLLVAVVCLLPYWWGELNRGFGNTRKIIATVLNSGQDANSLSVFQRVGRIVQNYFELGQQAYFVGLSDIYWWASVVVLSISLLVALTVFRGNRLLLAFLLFTWLVYAYASSNHLGLFLIHFKMPLLIAPVIFTILALAYLNTPDHAHGLSRVISGFLVGSIVLSIATNLYYVNQYLAGKYGAVRAMTPNDTIEVLEQLPDQATICDPKIRGWREVNNDYQYLNQYFVQKTLSYEENCQPGSYRIYPKYQYEFLDVKLWPILRFVPAQTSPPAGQVIYETSVARLYQVK